MRIRTLLAMTLTCIPYQVLAQGDAAAPKQTVFTNVKVFNGTDNELLDVDVLVEGNMIKKLGDLEVTAGANVIDGGGRTLMPGLFDTHVHLMFASLPMSELLGGDPGYVYIHAVQDANTFFMNGVTTVRDMAGDTFALKRGIDEGIIPGPRIYPSGSLISQTGGHADFRFRSQLNPIQTGNHVQVFENGTATLADGVPLLRTATRENLRKGASQIKLAAGGGYGSPADPLRGNQFSYEEIKAAVDAAADWGTYVTVHSYHPSAINRAIDAGIKDVGHGQLLDKATLERMAKEGVFLSAQPFTVCHEDQLSAFSNAKLSEVCKGTEFVYKTAKEIDGLKVTYGTDAFNLSQEDIEGTVKQMERLLKWYEPFDILKMATGNAGELVKMSGMRDPYPDGALGVVAEGAYADMLLVDGNPLDDLTAVTDNTNILIIMKDGEIYKNEM